MRRTNRWYLRAGHLSDERHHSFPSRPRMPDSFGGSDADPFMPWGTNKYSGGGVHLDRAARPGCSRQACSQGDHRTRLHVRGHNRAVCHRPEVLMADRRHLQALARPRLSRSHTRDRRGAHRPVDAGPPRNALAVRDGPTSTTGPPTGRGLSDVRAFSNSGGSVVGHRLAPSPRESAGIRRELRPTARWRPQDRRVPPNGQGATSKPGGPASIRHCARAFLPGPGRLEAAKRAVCT